MKKHQEDSSQPQRVHIHAFIRLRDICNEIRRGRFPNKDRLAEVAKRNRRTVQRDLDRLRNDFDAPLEYNREERGFYFSQPGWQLPPFNLSQGELIGFFAAERLLRRLGENAPEVTLVRDAMHQLAALLPAEVKVDLGALESAINFAPEPAAEVSPDILRQLAEAAASCRTLRINYFSHHRNAHTERDVDVLMLHNDLGDWYAVCFDHDSGEQRDFHAGRILTIAETGRTFTPPAGWNRDDYLRRGFGMFRGGNEVTVEVEFDAYQARYARERKFHPTQQRHELPDGRLRLTFETTEAAQEQVARWLMQYGEHAQAVRPKALREMMCERLAKTIALYENSENEE